MRNLWTSGALLLAGSGVVAACNSTFLESLTSQDDVSSIEGCTAFKGNLKVNTTGVVSISLSNLTFIDGDLVVYSKDISGIFLQNVGSISGLISLDGCNSLAALQVDSLRSVGGSVSVTDTSLISLSLPLTSLGTQVSINSNWNLTEIRMDLISDIEGIGIHQNNYLQTISFARLQTVEVSIDITENDNVIDMTNSFPLLTTVNQDLNFNLRNLTHYKFPSLAYVGNNFIVEGDAISCVDAQDPTLLNVVVKGKTFLQCGTGATYQSDTLDFTWIFGVAAGLILLGVLVYFTPTLYKKAMERFGIGQGHGRFARMNDDAEPLQDFEMSADHHSLETQ